MLLHHTCSCPLMDGWPWAPCSTPAWQVHDWRESRHKGATFNGKVFEPHELTFKALASQLFLEGCCICPVAGNVLDSLLVRLIALVCIVWDLGCHRLLAAGQQGDFVASLYELTGQVDANESCTACMQHQSSAGEHRQHTGANPDDQAEEPTQHQHFLAPSSSHDGRLLGCCAAWLPGADPVHLHGASDVMLLCQHGKHEKHERQGVYLLLQALSLPCAQPVNCIKPPETTETEAHVLRRLAGP